MQRGLRRVGTDQEDLWEFTRDLKHRVGSLYGYPQEVMKSLASEVKCPHLIIKAQDGRLYEKTENVTEILDIYQNNSKFKLVKIPGNHHVHLNSAETVWTHIHDFIKES